MSDRRPDPNAGFPNPDLPEEHATPNPAPGTGAGTSTPAVPVGQEIPGDTKVTDPNAGAPVGQISDQAEEGDEPVTE